MNDKNKWRRELKKRRAHVSPKRREEAAVALLSMPLPSFGFVLSFTCFRDEIDTTNLNLHLAQAGRLLLPKIEGTKLKVYRVTDLDQQLKPTIFDLLEPISSYCEEVAKDQVQIVLVPGLGFDKSNYRLGYGKGYYDRFLTAIPNTLSMGIGFKEQLIHSLPTEQADIALTKIHLF